MLPAGFIEAIRAAAPDDDTPRLVAADALEEQGEAEYAEFIRTQVKLSLVREPHACGMVIMGVGCWVCRLRRRERELLAAHGERWFGRAGWEYLLRSGANVELYDGGDHTLHLTMRRGFVDGVRCSCASWLAHGPAIVRAHPLTKVVLADKRPQLYRGTNAADWTWWVEWGGFGIPERLPRGIWDCLPGQAGFAVSRHYATEAEALESLSLACLRWAGKEG